MTYTHLTVGTSKLPSKPPRSTPPCVEPYVKGSNILSDPGVELYQSLMGRTEIGVFDGSVNTLTYPSDSTVVPAPYLFASKDRSTTLYGEWDVSTASPRTGTYSLRLTPGSSFPSSGFWLVVDKTCEAKPSGDRFYVARVEPGDFVSVSYWIKATDLTHTPYTIPKISFNAADGSNLAGISPANVPLGTSYAQVSHSAFAPASSVYTTCYIQVDGVGNAPHGIMYVDDFVLAVS